MESNGGCEEKEEEIQEITSTCPKLNDFIPIYIPTIEKGLINQSCHNRRLLDFLKAHPSNEGTGRRFRVPLIRKINWPFIIRYCKNWIRHPTNIALLIWLFFVASGLVVLFLLITGILNHAIPKSSQRTKWTEIDNQILNALFTIMCLYQYPRLVHHLLILFRWRSSDAVELRQAYCKSGVPMRSCERTHMVIVILLLHVTCWSQYVLCALYWGWTSKSRPEWAENVCIGIGTGAPVIAGLYTVFSPLGKKANVEIDEELQKWHSADDTEPEWVGGLFDCRDDITVASLSFFCTFCVFGWHVERLGFGNMYVHIVTFLLVCIGPLLVFNIAALNIADDTSRLAMRIAGMVLCFLGLLYGGYWRSRMRKKYKLPRNPFCCGDWMQWLLCWPCSLAQEVRTGNFLYEKIEEGSFYKRDQEGKTMTILEPLPRDGPMIHTGSVLQKSSTTPLRMARNSSAEYHHNRKGDQKTSPLLQRFFSL